MGKTQTIGPPFSEEDFKNIKAKRLRGAVFRVTVDFLSALGTLLCMFDTVSLIGLPIAVAGFTLGSFMFFGILGLVIIGGALWAWKKAREYNKAREKEKKLMEDCNGLFDSNQKLITNISKKYPNRQFQSKPIHQDPPEPMTIKRFIMKAGNRIMAFLAGAGTTLGISGLVLSAVGISIPTLLLTLTPLGWGILAAVALFAIGVGIATVVAQYKFERSQEMRIQALECKQKQLEDENVQWKLFEKQCEIEELRKRIGKTSESIPLDAQYETVANVANTGIFSSTEALSTDLKQHKKSLIEISPGQSIIM